MSQFEEILIQVLLENGKGKRRRPLGQAGSPMPAQANYSGKIRMRDRMEADKKRREAPDPHAEKVTPGVQPKRGPKGSQSDAMNWLSSRMEGHPSGSQARLRRELGDESYAKLTAPKEGEETPVQAAARRRALRISKKDLYYYKGRPSRRNKNI